MKRKSPSKKSSKTSDSLMLTLVAVVLVAVLAWQLGLFDKFGKFKCSRNAKKEWKEDKGCVCKEGYNSVGNDCGVCKEGYDSVGNDCVKRGLSEADKKALGLVKCQDGVFRYDCPIEQWML